MLPTGEEWDKMKQADVRTADKSQLIDLCEVEINPDTALEERIASYLEKVKNPYLVRIGDYAVKFSYQESGEVIEKRLLSYILETTKIRY